MPTGEKRQYTRDAAVALAMLAALGATVGGAWLLVYVNEGPARLGAELVEQIQSRGLDTFWQGARREYWYSGENTWTYRLRFRTDDGTWLGVTVRDDARSWEVWTLDARATKGKYVAGTYSIRPGFAGQGIETNPDTVIEYDNGAISADQMITSPNRRKKSDGQAPDNYVPEGTLRLARRLVAKRDAPAAFQFIVNTLLPFGNTPRFVSVRYIPAGTAQGRQGQTLRMVSAAHENIEGGRGRRLTFEEVYYIDPAGHEVKIVTRQLFQEEVVGQTQSLLIPEAEAAYKPIPQRLGRIARQLVKRAGYEAPRFEDPPPPPEDGEDDAVGERI
jgi:hypothetical protein